jgi:hypothetical protein
MVQFVTAAWQWITHVVSVLMPFKPNQPIAPALRWLVWIVLDLAVLVGLYFLNDQFDLTGAVRLPRFLAAATWLRHLYLPILGQLVILTALVLYWFYLLWFAPVDSSLFPDIDDAWREALRALAQAGIQLWNMPLFLVLGRPAGAEDQLFEAAGLKLVVAPTPSNRQAPVRVCADREAVYVTCRGASVLGKLAGILALDDIPEGPPPESAEEGEDLDKTHVAGRKDQGLIEMLRASAGQEATPLRKRAMRRAALGRPLGNDFLSDAVEVARCKARLAHLCRLMVRDRQPYCAANGILLVLPLGGCDSPAEAQLTAQAVQEDLAVARQESKLDCPLVALVADMEELPGFKEFMQSQPPKELGNRRGSGFPMLTRLATDKVLEQVRQSVSWICTTYMQDSVYRLFGVESAAKPDAAPLIVTNARLVLLLDEMRARAEPLASIIQQAIAPPQVSLLRYSGCYLAATGPKGSQAFVAGVLQKLVKEQNSVSWTPEAVAEDGQSRSWANTYFVAAAVLTVLWVLLLVYLITRG